MQLSNMLSMSLRMGKPERATSNAKTGEVLTGSQLQALERKKEEKEAHGEIETEHPGYLGSEDTFVA